MAGSSGCPAACACAAGPGAACRAAASSSSARRAASGGADQAAAGMACGGTSIRSSSACTSALVTSAPQSASVVAMPITSGVVGTALSRPWSLRLSTSGCSPIDRASCCWVRPTARRCSRTASRNPRRSAIRASRPTPVPRLVGCRTPPHLCPTFAAPEPQKASGPLPRAQLKWSPTGGIVATSTESNRMDLYATLPSAVKAVFGHLADPSRLGDWLPMIGRRSGTVRRHRSRLPPHRAHRRDRGRGQRRGDRLRTAMADRLPAVHRLTDARTAGHLRRSGRRTRIHVHQADHATPLTIDLARLARAIGATADNP